MTNKLERVNTIYKNNSQLKQLSQRVQLLDKLNLTLQQAMPPEFAKHCRLANINENTVIIHTDNASYASLLRFQSQALCQVLSQHLPQIINKLEVKVRTEFSPVKPESSLSLSLPSETASTLQQMSEDMEEGTLKVALQKLAKRQRE